MNLNLSPKTLTDFSLLRNTFTDQEFQMMEERRRVTGCCEKIRQAVDGSSEPGHSV
jgi:hypothetical protein